MPAANHLGSALPAALDGGMAVSSDAAHAMFKPSTRLPTSNMAPKVVIGRAVVGESGVLVMGHFRFGAYQWRQRVREAPGHAAWT